MTLHEQMVIDREKAADEYITELCKDVPEIRRQPFLVSNIRAGFLAGYTTSAIHNLELTIKTQHAHPTIS